MSHLTKRIVDGAKPGPSQVTIWDNELPGFGLRTTPAGTKSFVLDYKAPDGRRRRMTLGRYPVISTEQARVLAKERLAQVAHGSDPMATAQEIRDALTFDALSKEYLSRHADANKKAKSVAEDRRLLDTAILPELQALKVADITRADVAKLHSSLSKTPTQANRVVALLSKMFALAEVWGYRPDHSNPCRGIEHNKESKRKRYLTSKELQRLGSALEAKDQESPACVLAVRLLLLSGMRVGEVLPLRWSDLDLARGVLHLADSKTGAKDVMLGGAALQVLADASQHSEWVIPSTRRPGRHLVNLNGFWEDIRKTAKIPDVRLHDLRHTFGATGAGAGLSLPMVGALLGHSQAATTQRYAHVADAPQKHAADVVSGEIAAQLAKREPAEVVALQQ